MRGKAAAECYTPPYTFEQDIDIWKIVGVRIRLKLSPFCFSGQGLVLGQPVGNQLCLDSEEESYFKFQALLATIYFYVSFRPNGQGQKCLHVRVVVDPLIGPSFTPVDTDLFCW